MTPLSFEPRICNIRL